MAKSARNRVADGPRVMENPVPLQGSFDSFYIGEVDGLVSEILKGNNVEGLMDKDADTVKRRWVRLKIISDK